MLFHERIRRRQRLWWQTPRLSLHTRTRCRFTELTRDDPLWRWHCCRYWQRKLSNKWNSREFAARLGIDVPELYWSGTDVDALAFSEVPAHYAIRAVAGHSSRQVFVMVDGVDLLRREELPHAKLREQLRAVVRGGPVPLRLLVEEYLGDAGALPLDYKVYLFGGYVAAIDVMQRSRSGEFVFDSYGTDWETVPFTHDQAGKRLELPRPACLDRLLEAGRAFGRAFGSFVRVDFYLPPRGPVFGECTSLPTLGWHFSHATDEAFGRLWDEHCPGTI